MARHTVTDSQPLHPSVLFVIRALQTGGAERQLVAQAIGLKQRGYQITVAVFYGGGSFEHDLGSAGIPVFCLHKRSRHDVIAFAYRFIALVRRVRPDIVYSFMFGANAIAALLKGPAQMHTLVWGVRSTVFSRARFSRSNYAVMRLSKYLAMQADLVIANSIVGASECAALGYPTRTLRVVPNGVDTSYFVIARERGEKLRKEWGIMPDEKAVGLVGRLDPMKNHKAFLDSVAILCARRQDIKGVCVIPASSDGFDGLRSYAGQLGIAHAIVWVESPPDMPGVYNALDVLCSTSTGEGFSNTISEAMSCGVPCAATDVGDASHILGASGILVRSPAPEALADAVATLFDADRERVGHECRSRILENFSLQQLIDRTDAALRESLLLRAAATQPR